jgi:predicted transcriptional regulator
MNELGVNQNQLAEILKITQPAISKYLQGRIPPPFVLLELSKLSQKSIEWILTGDEETQFKSDKVAEKSSYYATGDSLHKKIEQLPLELRKKMEALIDTLLEQF